MQVIDMDGVSFFLLGWALSFNTSGEERKWA